MQVWAKFEIPKRHSHCAICEEDLKRGKDIYSLLLEQEGLETLKRKDFCLACWNTRLGSEKEKSKGYWKSHLELKEPHEKGPKLNRAFVLLQELLETPDEKEQEIFILALFLAHARQLVLRQELKEEGISYHLYEVLHQEKFVTIKVPALSSSDIEKLEYSLVSQLRL